MNMSEIEGQLGQHEARLATLEEGQAELRQDVKSILREVGEINTKLAVAAVIKPCPSPGACLTLAGELQKTNEKVSSLQLWKNGICVGGTIVWFIICIAGYMAYDALKAGLEVLKDKIIHAQH